MKPDTRTFYEQAVQRAAEHIVGTLDQAPDFEFLARGAAMSPFHFHRVFRGMLGETPLELHRRLRMERAAVSLIDGDAPVTTIAFDAGYEAHEAFTRAFRVRFGCTPSEFRKRRTQNGPECVRPPQPELATRTGIHFSRDPMLPTITFSGGHPMHVEITERPELHVAAVRHIGAYNRISEAFGRLHELVAPAGLLRPDTIMLAVYHDDPETTPEEDLRSDASITIPASEAIPAGLARMVISAGRYAHMTHLGPYEGLDDAWARLMGEWLPSSGHRFGDGVSYEVYRNNPTNAKPHELITDMYIPLTS